VVCIMTLLNSANICSLRFEVSTAFTVTEEYMGRDMHCSPKRLLISITLHGVTSRKIVFFILQNV
jgi:hypothetical protein